MKKIIGIAMLFLTISTWGNDGVYYTSGNQLIPLAETDIKVSKEILTISLQDNGMAMVDVYYEFLNPTTKPKTLLMGFEAMPSYNDDYTFHPDGKHPHIKDFTVEMNGQRLGHKNAVSRRDKFSPLNAKQWDLDDDMGLALVNKTTHDTIQNFAYVYYFNATFEPGINKVHHTYAYTMSMAVGMCYEVQYALTPASRWAGGKIGDFTLVVRTDHTAKHFLVDKNALPQMTPKIAEGTGKYRTCENTKWEISLRNGAVTFHKAGFHPTEELCLTSADVMMYDTDSDHFGNFYDRSNSNNLLMWKMRTENDITPKEKAEMQRIAHNLPYAHRGRIFKKPEIKRFFEAQWWYMPDPNYTDNTSDFTKSDWEYIKF